jgi:diguanylate cyclase (GGDEF)-like protein
LAEVLDRAARRRDQDRRGRQTGEALKDCHRRVGRLLSMLWENAPVDGRTRWYSQRHMLERLQEELARVARHGGQFSVVVGEVRARPGGVGPDEALLAEWVSDHVHRTKRRCDVLGHYGPNGFLLLLPHTAAPGAAAVCQRLRYALEQTPPRPPLPAAVLLGNTSCGDGRASPKAILRRAEESLDEARAAAAVGLVS